MKVVKITWVDSANTRLGWNSKSIDKLKYTEIVTIGFLISEDDNKILISHSYSDTYVMWYDAFVIPKVAIKKIDVLRV